VAHRKSPKSEAYRERAKELLGQSQSAGDEGTKRSYLELANSWLELARRAEELEASSNTGT
jgi:hypothetical protein